MGTRMIFSANYATWSARKHVINKSINSIIDQVDVVRVYYNDYTPKKRDDIVQYTGKDLTDKGKFYGISDNEIAFTVDDDLLFPNDYVFETLEAMERCDASVITYHGRKLKGKGLNYYRGHQSFHFGHTMIQDKVVDVPGTGVMAFDTREFMPDILQYDQQKMVDLLFALEAKKKGIEIVCARHKTNWIGVLTNKSDIYSEMLNSCEEQGRLADMLISS